MKKLIYLDPGHGAGRNNGSTSCPGYDPGACFGDVTEASRNLDMALTMKFMLEQAGFAAKLTHTGNEGAKPDLWQRVKVAIDARADAYLSLHWDTATLKTHSQGVYYAPGIASLALGGMITARQATMTAACGKPWLKPSTSSRFNGLYVDAFPDNLPSVLVEFDSVKYAPRRGAAGKAARMWYATPVVEALKAYLKE